MKLKPFHVALLALAGYFLYSNRAQAATVLNQAGIPARIPGSQGFNPVSGAPESYIAAK